MRSLQDYIDIYANIASKLNLQGASVEMLTQMLANASYISEVENIAYARESSLESATLLNSKIQHCVNDMYSVFRGTCPRVILNIQPTKYFTFNLFDEIVTSNNFKIYYLGYYRENSTTVDSVGTSAVSEGIPEFTYAPLTISPSSDTYVIMGLLAKETVSISWTLNQNNTYFVNCLEEQLSNDLWVKVNADYFDVTREFSDHILNRKIFDLTIPSFGSRLYVADIFKSTFNREETLTPANTYIEALYYKYTDISEYNLTELKRITIKGANLVALPSGSLHPIISDSTILSEGLYYVPGAIPSTVPTIHYKANRDRYVNSILRSNSDIGTVLEEMYPDKVKIGGTSYKFDGEDLNIYYVPQVITNLLTDEEIEEFIETRSAYYVTETVNIIRGTQYTAKFTILLDIYQNLSVDSEIEEILSDYAEKFNTNLELRLEEIKSLISKISNVKLVKELNISFTNEDGSVVEGEIDLSTSYFQVDYTITSTIQPNY